MSKVIFIGECALQVTFTDATPHIPAQATFDVHGTLPGAACLCAGKHSLATSMVGETARDFLGDMLVERMEACGVETRSIDRFTEGGATTVVFSAPGSEEVIHSRVPDQDFDTVWPRVDPGDIVVFGGFFAIRERSRRAVLDIINHAADRKATVIYVPGFPASLAPRITKVMPAILENLELAQLVITTTGDLRRIFGTESPESAFRENICFHTPAAINIDTATGRLSLMAGNYAEHTDIHEDGRSVPQVLAAVIKAMESLHITSELLPILPQALASQILSTVSKEII